MLQNMENAATVTTDYVTYSATKAQNIITLEKTHQQNNVIQCFLFHFALELSKTLSLFSCCFYFVQSNCSN